MPNHLGFKKIIGEKIEVKRCAVGGNKKTATCQAWGALPFSLQRGQSKRGHTERPDAHRTQECRELEGVPHSPLGSFSGLGSNSRVTHPS